MRKYYEAYDERYKTVHLKGVSWSSDKSKIGRASCRERV